MNSLMEDILVTSILIVNHSFPSFGWLRYLKIFLPLCAVCTGGVVFAWVLLVAFVKIEVILWDEDVSAKDRLVLGRPLLFPSQLTHARLFPDKYHYGIDYFLVGIPVGLRGRVGQLISIDSDGRGSNSPTSNSLLERVLRKVIWFSFDTSQYLHRGDGHMTLNQKLEHFLKEQVCVPPTVENGYALIIAGRGYRELPLCISHWRPPVLVVDQEPYFVLVSLLPFERAQRNHYGNQQFLRREKECVHSTCQGGQFLI